MKILIAEDDASSRVLLKFTLHKLGHEVITAGNGREAWETLQREPIPLVISDWMMPEINGVELCRRIRAAERTPRTYVLLLTAVEEADKHLEGMDAGADDVLTKPVDKDQLAVRLRVAERMLRLNARVLQLECLLPVCPSCRKIRQHDGTWTPLDQAVVRTDASILQDRCPECTGDR